MNWSSRLFAVVAALAATFALSGCGPASGRSWGLSSGSGMQSDDGTAYFYSTMALTRDNQVYLILAAARGTGNTYRGGEGKYQGELHAKDGVRIPWSCATQDGQRGKVVIDKQEFDFAAGALFLVSTTDKSAHVQQLAIDSAQLQTGLDVKKFLGVIKANPEMANFLELCKNSD